MIAIEYYSVNKSISVISDGCDDIRIENNCNSLDYSDPHWVDNVAVCEEIDLSCHALLIKYGTGIYGL